MKQSVCLFSLAVLLISCLLLGGCSDNSRATALLSRADSLMAGRPDSALLILDSLLTDSDRLSANFVMQCRLRRLNAINKLDTVFTTSHVSQAKALTDHFDNHGTPNEQMLAYYLLGRTYADAGEAPCAIEAYNTAADRADTTAIDCDYKTLCRVYAQKSEILYHQNLQSEYFHSADQAIRYAWKANDTIAVLNEKMYKIVAYNDMEKYDSVESIFDEVFPMFTSYYGIGYASKFSVLPIKAFLSMKKIEKVRTCLDYYERHSGYIDSTGNVVKGHEIYYYYKGQYFLYTNQLDSAEFFFRKELDAKDYNNQNAATLGLAQLFQQKSKPDSAAKYALYSYAMNDSAYNELTTNVLAQSQSMYNYNRHQRQAEIEREKATKAEMRLYVILILCAIIIVGIVLIACVAIFVSQLKRKNMLIRYHRKAEELRKAQESLDKMRQQENQPAQVVSNKEQQVIQLQSDLDTLLNDKKLRRDMENGVMEECGISRLLNTKSASGRKLSEEDWKVIEQFVNEHLPSFHKFIEDHSSQIGLSKIRVCILLRFRVGVKGTASMMGVSSPYISRISSEILSDLFHTEGSGKTLTQILATII